jgi:hypothetical protein
MRLVAVDLKHAIKAPSERGFRCAGTQPCRVCRGAQLCALTFDSLMTTMPCMWLGMMMNSSNSILGLCRINITYYTCISLRNKLQPVNNRNHLIGWNGVGACHNRVASFYLRRGAQLCAPTIFAFGAYSSTTVTPSPPSPLPPVRKDLTSGWEARISRTIWRTTPVPKPWMIRTSRKLATETSLR